MVANANNERTLAKVADKVLGDLVDLLEKAFDEKSQTGHFNQNTVKQLKVFLGKNIKGVQAVVSVRSIYAFHAILYVLSNVKCSTFFKTLKQRDIDGLRVLIDAVKSYGCPSDPNTVDEHASKPVQKGDQAANMIRRIANIHVNVYILWNEITPVLDKWDRLLSQYLQTKNKSALSENEELWSFERLEREFSKYYEGPHQNATIQKRRSVSQAKSHRLQNCSQDEKALVESWFVRAKNPETGKTEKMFRASCVDDLKVFLGIKDEAETAKLDVAAQGTVTVENTAPTAEMIEAQEPSSEPVNENGSFNGMTGVKGLEAMLQTLTTLCLEAQSDMNVSKVLCDDASSKVADATTSKERSSLLQTAMDANARMDRCATEVEDYQGIIDKAEEALHKREELERLLRESDEQIASLLMQANEKIQAKAQ